MILSEDQINRYLRHIIMPEISGPGQKKIIESTIYIYSSDVKQASSLIYYLASSGVGHISCYFNDKSGFENLYSNIHDLNGDVVLSLIDNKSVVDYTNSPNNVGSVIRILTCKFENITTDLMNYSSDLDCTKFVPTIVAINYGWECLLQTFKNQRDFNNLLIKPLNLKSSFIGDEDGSILSSCLLGALSVIECLKLCLDLGADSDKPLYFDLLSMHFNQLNSKEFDLKIEDFTKIACNERPISVDHKTEYNTKKLSESKVLIIGAGGLGSPNVYALSSVGIGTIGLVDYDKVELSNLNRQIIHSTSRIEMSKVESAEVFIKSFNPNTKLITYNTSLNINNAMSIIKDYDVIVDALDNFPDRYLLNDACFFANKPLVDAAAVKTHGLIMTIIPNKSPCYRCAFPALVKPSGSMTCSEAGVLGPVPGVMGFIQATEVVKLLLNIGDTLSGRIIYYEALDSDFETINIDKSPNCDLCGTHPTITTLVEYKNSCEINN